MGFEFIEAGGIMPDRMWYYSSRGQQRGPIKTVQLKELALSGDLKPDDLVWCDGMANWAPASTVKGLFAEPSTAAVTETVAPPSGERPTQPVASPHEPRAAPHSPQMSSATQVASAASREAAGAFKTLLSDPIAGLARCYEELGTKRALQVGVVFLVAAVAVYSLAHLAPVKELLISLLSAAVAAGAMIGVSYCFRTLISRAASFHADVFVVGAASLPIALATLLESLLNPSNVIGMVVATTIRVFGSVFFVLILYQGQTGIVKLSERTGALAAASVAAAGAAAATLITILLH